jgi:hypothetical protein
MHTFNQLIQYTINSNKIYNINLCDSEFGIKENLYNLYEFWSNLQKYELNNLNSNELFLKQLFYSLISISYNNSNNYTSKFQYLKDILNNNFIEPVVKELFFNTFAKIQRTYRILSRFVYKYKFYKAEIQIHTDIFLSPITEKDRNVIVIFQNNKKYLFKINDLINILNSALGNTSYFFATPLISKNPYNNMPFSKADLYNIYFFIKSSNFIMPILIHNFFLSNFNLKKFKIDNEDNIREYAVKNYIENSSQNILINTIAVMLSTNTYTQRIRIHKDFPKKKLIDIMKPYLYLYLTTNYGTELNKRNEYEYRLNKKLKLFGKFNPKFGRKLVVSNVSFTNEKKYKTDFNDKYIPFYNEYDDDFMNNHLNTIEEEEYSDESDSDSDEDFDIDFFNNH